LLVGTQNRTYRVYRPCWISTGRIAFAENKRAARISETTLRQRYCSIIVASCVTGKRLDTYPKIKSLGAQFQRQRLRRYITTFIYGLPIVPLPRCTRAHSSSPRDIAFCPPPQRHLEQPRLAAGFSASTNPPTWRGSSRQRRVLSKYLVH
jgi:hypothetical protein